MSWLFFTILSVFLLMSYYFVAKVALKESEGVEPTLFAASQQMTVALLAFIVCLLAGGVKFEFSLQILPS